MSIKQLRILPVMAGVLMPATGALAQFPRTYNRDQGLYDTGPKGSYKIQRRTIEGTVKSVDAEKKALILTAKKAEVPIDASAGIIRAGKGSALVGDIQVGDRVTVFGETTIQGGLRAMQMTLPKERMSIPPPAKEVKPAKSSAPKSSAPKSSDSKGSDPTPNADEKKR